MRVLVLSQYWQPENGVPQRRWAWLTNVLVSEGHEVLVIAPPPHYRRKVSFSRWLKETKPLGSLPVEQGWNGETILRCSYIPSGNSLTGRALNQSAIALGMIKVLISRPKILRDFQPNIIVGTVPAIPTAMVTAIAAARCRTPYIIDLRDAWPDLLENSTDWNKGTGQESFREKILKKGPLQVVTIFTRRTLNKTLSKASAIIVTSSYLQKDLENRPELRKRGKASPTILVRNLFQMETMTPDRKESAGMDNTLRVLYAGTIGRAQNLENALRAAEIVSQRGYEIQFRFVGAGDAKKQLRRSARERNINAEFFGSQNATELDNHYAWAQTALVHLTNWEALRKAVPSKTYELMTRRIHITGVVAGETKDLIEKFYAGNVAPPESPEALAELWIDIMKNPKLLNISHAGKEWVRRARETEAEPALLEIFERVGGKK